MTARHERHRGRAGGQGATGPRRDLVAAVVTGAALVAVFIATLLAAPIAFTGLVAALVVAALVEASRVLRAAGRPVAAPVLVTAGAVLLAAAHAGGRSGQILGVLVLGAGTAGWVLVDAQARRDAVACAGNTLLLGLWVPFLGSFAVLLATLEQDAVVATLATIGAATVADIGAYAVGSTVGRHRIAPRVSPNKTWEGLIGGLVAAGLVAGFALPAAGDLFAAAPAAAFAVLVGVAAFFGDLFESLVKRDLGVKDFGILLPGHGGVLDRVDGILFALPVGYFTLLAIR